MQLWMKGLFCGWAVVLVLGAVRIYDGLWLTWGLFQKAGYKISELQPYVWVNPWVVINFFQEDF